MSDSHSASLRQLKIKTGVVKRLAKEEQTYSIEVEEALDRLEKLKKDGADGADIRNAERVVKDSEQMIPRTKDSLEKAVVDLRELIVRPSVASSSRHQKALSSESEVTESQEYKTAKMQLEEAKGEAAP